MSNERDDAYRQLEQMMILGIQHYEFRAESFRSDSESKRQMADKAASVAEQIKASLALLQATKEVPL